MTKPAEALDRLAQILTEEDTLLSPLVTAPSGDSALGELATAGRRCTSAPAEYALVVETIREGYLLHYGQPRVLACDDPDLALLAGDYLYARGLERLTNLGDLDAVGWLADLISASAQRHAQADPTEDLWLETVSTIGWGSASPDPTTLKQAAESIGFRAPQDPDHG